jgi:hypothetical protein
MRVFNTKAYTKYLTRHYEDHFDVEGTRLTLPDPAPKKLHKDFFVLEIPPNKRHNKYAYCTVGMSADRLDDNLTELFVFSPVKCNTLVALMTWCAAYHRNKFAIKTNHTVSIGQPWLHNSTCDHGLVSKPYVDGKQLELFHFEGHIIRCHWFIPITELERDYRMKYGADALEKLFVKKQLDYLNPGRKCLVIGD